MAIPVVNSQDVTTGNTDVLEGDELFQLRRRVDELQRFWEAEHAEVLGLRASNEAHSRMMERARALWQVAHPDQADRWPDGAKNVAWLVEEIERWRANAMAAAEGFERLREENELLRTRVREQEER